MKLQKKECINSIQPGTPPTLTKIENRSVLNTQIGKMSALMPEYYKNNADEKIKDTLLEISKTPELSVLANAFAQLLYTDFFYDNRYIIRPTRSKSSYDVRPTVWKSYLNFTSKEGIFEPLIDLIVAGRTLSLYLTMDEHVEKLRKITIVQHCMGQLIEDIVKKPSLTPAIISSRIFDITNGSLTEEEAVFMKPAIKDPTLFSVSTAFNSVSSMVEIQKSNCKQQYAHLTHYINSKDDNNNPIFHYTAYKHFRSNTVDAPTPEVKIQLANQHLLKAKHGGLSIAGLIHEDLAEVGTEEDYKKSKSTLEKLYATALNTDSKLPHPKALLQLGRLEQTYGHYKAAEKYFQKASDSGCLESYRYLARLRLEVTSHKLLSDYNEKRLSLTLEAKNESKIAHEAAKQKEVAALRRQQKREAQLKAKENIAKQRAAIKAQAKLERNAEQEKQRLEKEAADKARQEEERAQQERLAKEALEKEAQRKIQAEKRAAIKAKKQEERQRRSAEKREKLRAEKAKRQAQKRHLEKLEAEKAAKLIEQEKQAAQKLALEQKEADKSKQPETIKPEAKRILPIAKIPMKKTQPTKNKETKKTRHFQNTPMIHGFNFFDACYRHNNILTTLKVLYDQMQLGIQECRIFYGILSKITGPVESLYRLQEGLHNLQYNIPLTTPLLPEELG